jgi:MFS family permease
MTEMSRVADHNVIATYPSPDEARAALVALERKGVEAADIELFGPGMEAATMPVTNDEQRGADMNAVGAVARRGVIGVVIGALLGALVGFVIASIAGGSPGWQAGSALAGFVAGGPLGFLYAGYSGLSVSEEWGETFESTGGRTSVAVHATDRSEFERALDALRSTHADRLCTCGRDGQLRDVA